SALPLVELLLLDAQTKAVLARPPAMLLGEVESFLRRIGRAPVSDPTRPLHFFGDPLPYAVVFLILHMVGNAAFTLLVRAARAPRFNYPVVGLANYATAATV